MNTSEILKSNIDSLYPQLMSEQETLLREHWSDFNSQKAMLEGVVAEEFGKVMKEIGPIPLPEWALGRQPPQVNPEILDYRVEYSLQSKDFQIKITKFKLPNGKIMDNKDVFSSQYGCPHVFLEAICG